MLTNPADSLLASLALAAEDMFTDPDVLTPPASPRLAAAGWQLRGHLAAVDAVLSRSPSSKHVYYGYVAEDGAGNWLVAVRGTQRMVEWLEDLEGWHSAFNHEPIEHPAAGQVHCGMWEIYASLALVGDISDLSAANGIAALCAGAKHVTVIGHSLGAAESTFLSVDLASRFTGRLSARHFASPRTGNKEWTQYADTQVADCAVYANANDLVPKVPFGFGYSPLGSLIDLPPPGILHDNPLCNHHAGVYSWILDRTTAEGVGLDQQTVSCLASG
jgi:triacylglycerol lipase